MIPNNNSQQNGHGTDENSSTSILCIVIIEASYELFYNQIKPISMTLHVLLLHIIAAAHVPQVSSPSSTITAASTSKTAGIAGGRNMFIVHPNSYYTPSSCRRIRYLADI